MRVTILNSIFAVLLFTGLTANAADSFLTVVHQKYNCYYGISAETTYHENSILLNKGNPLCIADIYCTKKLETAGNFASEAHMRIVCSAPHYLCPEKAEDCLADSNVENVQIIGSESGTLKYLTGK